MLDLHLFHYADKPGRVIVIGVRQHYVVDVVAGVELGDVIDDYAFEMDAVIVMTPHTKTPKEIPGSITMDYKRRPVIDKEKQVVIDIWGFFNE